MWPPIQKEQKGWDKVLMTLFSVPYVGWILLSELDADHFYWSSVPVSVQVILICPTLCIKSRRLLSEKKRLRYVASCPSQSSTALKLTVYRTTRAVLECLGRHMRETNEQEIEGAYAPGCFCEMLTLRQGGF
jgi:hypothetical protein